MSNNIEVFREKLANPSNFKISYIIPFMYVEDRYPLFLKTIENLPNTKYDEICIAEIGRESKFKFSDLETSKKNIKHQFFYYDSDVMHRGWALNLGAKHIATGELFVLLDADIVVSNDWKELVRKTPLSPPLIGWSKLYYLDKKSTEDYLNGSPFPKKFEKVKEPSLIGAAGGCTIISSDIFHEIKGVPENFEGSWGGPDNTLLHKIKTLGYPIKKIDTSIYHLHHEHQTPRQENVRKYAKILLNFTKFSVALHQKNLGCVIE